jgi:hypothetical protein
MLYEPTPTRLIPLSQGYWTLVDVADYDWLRELKWHVNGRQGEFLYAFHSVSRKSPVKMHRMILGLTTADPHVDHINGDGLDNRRCNLRLATRFQNAHNRRRTRTTMSGYKGVHWKSEGGWAVTIRANGVFQYLGRFRDPVEAARVWDAAAVKLHGEFARLNFP